MAVLVAAYRGQRAQRHPGLPGRIGSALIPSGIGYGCFIRWFSVSIPFSTFYLSDMSCFDYLRVLVTLIVFCDNRFQCLLRAQLPVVLSF